MKRVIFIQLFLLICTVCMADIVVIPSQTTGKIKPMNAVNNGPVRIRSDQSRGNFPTYEAAKIPFARTHDASFFSAYGGHHSVDITGIFPDFSKDANDPASYDFVLTDEYLESIQDAGTKVFFRLGQRIEHEKKKYGILPPADFQKWAVICEHIIRHYTEGWANGFRWDIQYWEIWGDEEEINDFLDLNSISSENLAKFLVSSIKSSNSINLLNGSSKTQWTFDFEKLKKYYDYEKLINVMDESKAKISDETTLNIFNLFLKELNQYLGK